MPGKSRTVRPPEFDVLIASTRDETARLQPGVHSLSICESSKTSAMREEERTIPKKRNESNPPWRHHRCPVPHTIMAHCPHRVSRLNEPRRAGSGRSDARPRHGPSRGRGHQRRCP